MGTRSRVPGDHGARRSRSRHGCGQRPAAAAHHSGRRRGRDGSGGAHLGTQRSISIDRHVDAGFACQESSDSWTAHTNLGAALGNLGRTEEAIGHYREALRLLPNSAEAHNNLGHALALQRRLSEAVVHYEEAVRLNPGNQTARDNLARVRELELVRQSPAAVDP